MLSAKYGFLIKFFINRKVQGGFVTKAEPLCFCSCNAAFL